MDHNTSMCNVRKNGMERVTHSKLFWQSVFPGWPTLIHPAPKSLRANLKNLLRPGQHSYLVGNPWHSIMRWASSTPNDCVRSIAHSKGFWLIWTSRFVSSLNLAPRLFIYAPLLAKFLFAQGNLGTQACSYSSVPQPHFRGLSAHSRQETGNLSRNLCCLNQ